jgi:hypothetical protein
VAEPSQDEKNVDMVYGIVKKTIAAKKITPASITILVTTTLAEAMKLPNLSHPEEKQLAIHVISKLIDEIPTDDENKQALQGLLVFLPATVDSLISAANGELAIATTATAPATPPATAPATPPATAPATAPVARGFCACFGRH